MAKTLKWSNKRTLLGQARVAFLIFAGWRCATPGGGGKDSVVADEELTALLPKAKNLNALAVATKAMSARAMDRGRVERFRAFGVLCSGVGGRFAPITSPWHAC